MTPSENWIISYVWEIGICDQNGYLRRVYKKYDDMKKYYNPYLKNCPTIWNYNLDIDGVQYCRKNGANLPIFM